MSVAQHLPALQVVGHSCPPCSPFSCDAPPRLSSSSRPPPGAAFAISITRCKQQVAAEGTLLTTSATGNSVGIEYRIDRLNSFVLVLVSGIAALVLPLQSGQHRTGNSPRIALSLLRHARPLLYRPARHRPITGDAFNLFVFLEISSLSTYVLIALGRDRRALTASYQYLIMGSIGATFSSSPSAFCT